MRTLTITLGFTASDRAEDYVPCMDGYRPGARQTLLTIGPLAMPGTHPDKPLNADEASLVADSCFAAMNMPAPMPVADRIAVLRAAIDAAVSALAASADPAFDGVHSLSVGDTVSVDGVTLSCEQVGWAVVQ